MKRARISQTLLATFLVSAAAGAASAADTRSEAAPVAYGGAYVITFSVNLGSSLPPGSSILCRARALPRMRSLGGFEQQAQSSSIALVSPDRGSPAGSWANCTVQVPFYWIGDRQAGAPAGSAVLSYEIDAVLSPGAQAVPIRIEPGIGVQLPSPGGVARLNFQMQL